jgi:hypothetical protein
LVKLLLSGGLGNQLFQLFFALNFIFSKGIDKENLFVETNYNFVRDKKYRRKYALDALGIIIPATRLTFMQRLMVKKKIRRILGNSYTFWRRSTIIVDDDSDLKTCQNQHSKVNYIIDGYFQNSIYANQKVTEYVRSLLQLDQDQKEHLAIHIRHFDPGGFENSKNLQLSFYVDACKDLLKICQPESIIVIGEDTRAQEALKRQLEKIFTSPIKLSRNPDQVDFELIMNSKYLIGSMSTFCLSAYFLSVNEKIFVRFPTENSLSKYHSWDANRLGVAELNK